MFRDFLAFRRMLSLYLIQALFWLGIVGLIILVFINFYDHNVGLGIITLFIGPLVWRLLCESLLVLFRMNDTLTDIKNALNSKAS
ncbi:MAG: hypothetical protein QM752_04225 [Gammaproteobacteria bacterium]